MPVDPSSPHGNIVATDAETSAYRKQRVIRQLVDRGFDAVILTDPINIRYATDVSNMQLWTAHSPGRYALVCADGHTVAFEFKGSEHLARCAPTVDEARTACNWFYFAAGERMEANVQMWADEIVDIVRDRSGPRSRVAVDRLDPPGVDALRSRGFEIGDGQIVLEQARCIKNSGEIRMIRNAISVAESGMSRMHIDSTPGRSENQIWAGLHHENIAAGGEWIETRLLTIGHRTNPWFQEASAHFGVTGDVLAVDTDMIGPNGYCADISRTWTIGQVPFSPAQRCLYLTAVDQIEHNVGIIEAGMSFDEFNARSWRIPDAYQASRYAYAFHGVGMADEWPGVPTHIDFESYFGSFEVGMVVCVESLIAEPGGRESIKLETQLLVTESGAERLDSYPWEDH